MLYGRTVRSTVPCGEVLSIVVDAPGCTVVDFRDIPGRNAVARLDLDQPCLVEREIRHAAEPILLLAHADPRGAARAPGSRSRCGAAMRCSIRGISPRDFKQIAIDKGDLDGGLRRAPTG